MKKNVSNLKAKRKVSFIHSQSLRVILLVLFSVISTSLICGLIVIPQSKQIILNSAKNNMVSMERAYADVMNRAIRDGSVEAEGYDEYDRALSSAGIEGLSSSYAYCVSSDGTMLYHPIKDKVGAPVENAVITKVVADMAAGNVPEGIKVADYDFRGILKYAVYTILDDQSILIISADEDEILADIDRVQNLMYAGVAASVLIIGILGFIFARILLRPLTVITHIIQDTAQFQFKKNPAMDKLCKRKDEIGYIGRAVTQMSENLRGVVTDIEDVSGH